MTLRLLSCGLLLVAASLPARASNHILYECVDANGTKQFTNIPANPKECKVLNVGPVSAPAPAPPPVSAREKPRVKSPPVATPSSFPRVDRALQRERDNDRRRILEIELGNEEKLLAQAKKELAEQESVRRADEKNYQRVLDRLEPYQKKVRLHEDNVANLRREISKIR
ncbi:MAG TPA: DUF4124 domain-containing protein [Burkholderiales bacterium]|nr:DUF4124 domain-containing protein [Burkholderiales bacterium]